MTNKLLIAGSVLILIGLCHGFVPHLTPNKTLGISAHVSAIQNGTILLVFASVWHHADIRTLEPVAGWLSIVGMYCLWLGLFSAAVMGLKSPMASTPTTVIQFAGSFALLAGFVLLFIGFIRKEKE